MSNVVEQVKPEVEKAKDEAAEGANKLQEAMHRMMLAAVGAVGLMQDEVEHFVNKAVERGEIAEKEARKTVHEVSEKRKGAEKEDSKFLSKEWISRGGQGPRLLLSW